MTESKTIDILKGAILLEYRGKELYNSVVETTKNQDVKSLFQFLADEEEKHILFLRDQYKWVVKRNQFNLAGIKDTHGKTSEQVISLKVVKGIFSAGYEAAVISAALQFEKNAVAYYSDHAKEALSEDEAQLYTWLANWEKGHLEMLADLDKELKEQIWYDNNFWPLD